MSSTTDRVRSGAIHLDSTTPGWHLAIDPDRLGIACILTQQFGGLSGGLIAHGLTRYQGVELGFLTATGYGRKDGMTTDERAAYNLAYAAEEEALLTAWADEVEARRSLADEVEARDHWLSRINRHLPAGEALDESDLAPLATEEVGL